MSYLFSNKYIVKTDNFMSLFQESLAHCPKCSKPLLNGGQFSGWAEFCMRCPWCQATVTVAIQPKITASIKLNSQQLIIKPEGSFHSPQGEQKQKAPEDEGYKKAARSPRT